uniref:RHS repeat-associated core domain-containing protein n=1 Tax=Serratia proteamaculans TaxID=28151 RepID=UPI001F4C2E67|nr:RHS repeat domain-containing protein [Serratia proteamaculans]ULG18324.1 SppC [Serratia proteamaculans]
MSISLFSSTPSVAVLDNRGLLVRELQYHRHPDTPEETDERITCHQHDERGSLSQSADPRLHAAGLTNFTYLNSLTGAVLQSVSADAGTSLVLSDAAGRAFLVVTGAGTEDAVTRTWQYEDDTLPGRPLSITEQVTGEAAQITERFVYAGNTDAEKMLNLAGQCVSHYDTAGLVQTNSIALSGVPLAVTRQLLPDTAEANWVGEDASAWNDLLDGETFFTQTHADATGAVLGITDAKGNLQRVAYDVAGLLSGSWLTLKDGTEQVIVASLTYSAAGQKLREEHGNGVVTTYVYEPETQRLTGIKTERPSGHVAGAKVLQDLRYAYDPVGNVLSVNNDAEETRFWRNQKVVPENTYIYDSLYQLVSATGREMANAGQQGNSLPSATAPLPTDSSAYTNYTRTYRYDRGGNLTQMRHSAPATNNNYTTDITVSDRSNRAVLSTLAEVPSDVDMLFSAGGHQKHLQPGQALVWTPRGELQKVTPVVRDGGADDSESYRYDASSQRIIKTGTQQTGNNVQTQRVQYLPGLELRSTKAGNTETEGLQVITVGEAGRTQVRGLHWESGKPAEISNNQLRWSYDNLIGSSNLELDGDGNIISMEEYYPYGGTAVWTARSAVEADYKTIRYSGKERDATGLDYYGYRYYQSWSGRWLSADPAGTIDGLNLFRMVRNNPVTLMDNDGLVPYPRTRRPNSNLHEPKIDTEKDRDIPGQSKGPHLKNMTVRSFAGTPVSLYSALGDNVLHREALLTDLINKSKAAMDSETTSILENKEGGILAFNAIKLSNNTGDVFNALHIVNKKTTEFQQGPGAVRAYWAPQGGYVDIPVHPHGGEPELVFTPGFSGCVFVADKLSENTIRVRHVEGNKEDAQYNDESIDHGLGMIEAMEYKHYGYYTDENGIVIENITGSAFMRYEREAGSDRPGKWKIKYQAIENASNILSIQELRSGFINKKIELTQK